MNSLVINPGWPIDMRPQAPVIRSSVGGGSVQARRRTSQPYYEFEFKTRFPTRREAEEFSGFMAFHQQDIPFWFDGAHYGDIQNPIFIAFGNGTDKDFFLPYRNVFAPSSVFYISNTINGAWMMNESTGKVSFTTAPATNAMITWKGICKFKCLFWSDEQALSPRSEIFTDVHDQTVIIREVN